MAKNLVIVESPTKAKTIKKMLGSNYKVVASVGHIRDLPKSTLGIDIENNFEPKYINIRGKGDIIKSLKKDAKAANKVFLATDPDREGEAISWHLSHILDIEPTAKARVTFNEITKDTVKKQIKSPRSIDMNLVDAQQARRVLDRLVGYKISPLLWKKVKSGLSAGRVQSVVLKIICDREQEIEDFISEEYWSIEATLKKSRKSFLTKYYGTLENGKVKKVDIKNEKQADEILNKVDENNFKVSEIKKGLRKKNPNQPFTTSTLQQEASKKLNFSTKKTMMLAQRLYEGIEVPKEGSVGLITYMRTDSTRISPEALETLLSYIDSNYGKEYSKQNTRSKQKGNVQDAHECIRPTDVNRTPFSLKDSLSRDEFRLYNLIWRRFVASQMQPAIYDTINLSVNSNDEIFKASGSQISFDGFLKVYEIDSEKDNILPDLELNDLLKLKSIEKNQHFTQPPARYNEASLIKLLEEWGIGRPSTYSPIVSTLLSRYYVVLEEKKLIPTELGITVNEILVENFPDIVNEKFTAEMEDELDKVAEGEIQWKSIISEFYDKFEKELLVAEEKIKKVEIRDEVTDIKCEKCGRNMVIKMGRYGKFLACPGFPECRNAKPLVEKINVKCPKCDGDIVVKRSKKGRKFYGCSNYPECDFVTWNKPVDKKCPECNEILVEVNNRKEHILKCNNKTCSYREEVEGD
ncbi:type I DNA topoisomerase [Anaerosphaera multitolerans]|uniref:DNA topoisomerase 1 n=1 Tax=Anaerosphaera multitolerans TaxID=2487351 RepID=A0A437S8Q0_9FIRM|nr:type I DNA topoisomerase [Anaerosphaera multitolerans]RVU55311.1 type I DNA topoisomerase [Anaerosphaera multitolerans]